MTDTNATGDQQQTAGRRDRSPNFPAIGVGRAVERAQQLYNRARRYDARLADAATAWGIKATSSGTLQTAAALIAFGLAEDSGSGEARKIKISDLGWRILEDQRPGVREKGLAEAALRPKLIADYAEHWKAGRPDDNFCISELKIERGFTDEAAARFLRVFDETIQFANPASSDTVSDRETGGDRTAERQAKLPPDNPTPPAPTVKVGDYVQWTSGGIDQFKRPQRVVWLSDDGTHVRVEDSMTGVPVSGLTVSAPPRALPTIAAPPQTKREAGALKRVICDTNILMTTAGHLQITAEVNKEGLTTLRQMLDKYEGILEIRDLLERPLSDFPDTDDSAKGDE